MVFETLSLRFDVEQLQAHLQSAVLSLPPIMMGPTFGGWSVWSANGSYRDGWTPAHHAFERVNGEIKFNSQKAYAMGWRPPEESTQPTEICSGYLAEVMAQIQSAGLNPSRARISVLKSQSHGSLHRDGVNNNLIRLHIPIFTNPQCTFDTEGISTHLAADGSAYLLRVDRPHQIFNRGATDRFHLIMDIHDSDGCTHYHKQTANFALRLASHSMIS